MKERNRGDARIYAHSGKEALPGPEDIARLELANGITVLARANFNSPSVSLSGYLSTGSLFDTDEKLGLAYFTASALMRGTGKRNFQQIFDELESAGANLGFSGGAHTTGFGGKALVEDLPLLLGLLEDVLRQPAFPHEYIERLRAQHLTDLAIRAQDTAEMASLAFDQVIYAGHPYRRPDDGYPETISVIQRQDLVAFHQKYYGPRGMVIAIVGAIEPGRAIEQAADFLAGWYNPAQPEPPSLPLLEPLMQETRRKITIPGMVQADLCLGATGPARRSPDFLAASLGNSVLGQFGLYGRLGEIIREHEGLAYYVYSSLSGGSGPGAWYISAGVDPTNVDKVVDLAKNEIARFTNEMVSPQELEDSQASFIGLLPLSLESNAGVASALVNLERYQLGLDYYRRYADLVRALTPEQVLEVSQRYLDVERLAVAVAGP